LLSFFTDGFISYIANTQLAYAVISVTIMEGNTGFLWAGSAVIGYNNNIAVQVNEVSWNNPDLADYYITVR